MKETFYFSHDYNARNDQKILTLRGKFGLEGYALFWMCVETMAEEKEACIYRGAIGGLSLGYGVAIARLEEFIDYCININLFKEKDEKVYSERLVEHKKLRQELSKFGKKGAEKRWQNYSPPNGNKGKERKIKERKVNKPIAETSSAEEVPNLLEDKQLHVRIVGLYARAKKVVFENKEQQQVFIRRNVRASKELACYAEPKIIATMKWLLDNADFKWTIETIGKYIDENLEHLSLNGKSEKEELDYLLTK